MKKKVVKIMGLVAFIAIVIIAICNVYGWIFSGKQYIRINMPTKAYTNSDLYVTIIAQEKGLDIDTKSKLKLLDSKGKTVKDVNIKYNGNDTVLSIPKIEAGNYFIEANVSSKLGIDTIKKQVYISDERAENVTITLDKGIYKPGDTVNYRALLTSKENDEPMSKDINVSIYDGNDNKVYNENVKSSDFGIISGKFSLATEVNSGLYKLVVKTKNNEAIKQFKVNPYTTPKYEVKIDYDKESYLVGETAQITFNAKYFFGEAVQNANLTVYLNNEKYDSLTTNVQGIATMNYEIKNAKTYNIKVEAVDSSNYFVEATSSFTAGTDIFEVQLISEYGVLAAGRKNNVYVFTNKADGTPLKTYVTISSNNFTKQIATNENGIGNFSIDIEPISTYGYNTEKQFSVVAEDTNGNKVKKNLSFNVAQKSLLVSTDKVKYEQGEDIKINISSITENAKNVYFFKGDKLVKLLSTDSGETTINLDDTYGLVDIYVTAKKGSDKSYSSYYESNTYKRTIFIKPTKQLSININTDKQEYKPGEKIAISFNTLDENNSGTDAALLVSMLDNSILNLASNDLSIDNIKLALQDIKFSNDLDGATLYSCIVNDTSEQTMMALLLKQTNKDINVSESIVNNKKQEQKSAAVAVVAIAIIVVTIISFLCIKFKKFRTVMEHVVSFIMYDLLLTSIPLGIAEKFFWKTDYFWWVFGITSIIGLAIYILGAYKLNKKTFRTSMSIIISCLLFMLLQILTTIFDVPLSIICIVFAVALLAFAIVAKISEVKKLKIYKYFEVVIKEIKYALEFAISIIVSFIINFVLFNFVIRLSDMIVVPITLIFIYLINYQFIRQEKKVHKANRRITIIFTIIGVIIILLFVVVSLTLIIGNTQGIFDHRSANFDFGESIPDSTMQGATSNSSSIWDNTNEWFSTNKNMENSIVESGNNANKEESKTVIDDNVRNTFLESMCFIPELVTTGGQANINLNLSDNITTWTIQTIGNTKDGRVGYGILDSVKVFKDFFVDFELPKNLVETDKVSIPVTVYNYTENPISTVLKIKQEDWFTVGNNNININADAKSTNMVYVPITVLKTGSNKFRVEVSSNTLTDIVEKECTVYTKGYKVEKVVSAGNLSEDISEDILFLEDAIENTAKVKVKIYSSTISQALESMENIFKMPTGCFEQISSTLYPNILALKYLEDNGIVNEEIKTKALSYISSGYQKLLTYEVKGESGGYSLYGHAPAETVLTAYGLMEVTDLSKVYNVDNSVISKMTNFLYKKQNSSGAFTITGHDIGGASSRETLALNAYITWALSESNPNDERLSKSIYYLKGKLGQIDDNYTLALVANALANVKDSELNNVLKRLVNNINIDNNSAYIKSEIVDYYGARDSMQTIQTVALTSIALSKGVYSPEINKLLKNYLISRMDTTGTWHSTQATILALKALNVMNEKSKLENQTITVKVNSNEQKIEINDNPLEAYELTFENLNKENKLNIDIEKGSAYYEVIEEYYVPYEKVNTENDELKISVECNNNLNVNEILKANIKVTNKSYDNIQNGMVTISIPQGFTVVEESLMELESKGIIEKYEMSYTEVNIYLRNFEGGIGTGIYATLDDIPEQFINLNVWFRANYPVEISGMQVRAYDYYNPEIEGKTMPIEITVK